MQLMPLKFLFSIYYTDLEFPGLYATRKYGFHPLNRLHRHSRQIRKPPLTASRKLFPLTLD